jgi:hypothetical protein
MSPTLLANCRIFYAMPGLSIGNVWDRCHGLPLRFPNVVRLWAP